MNEKEYTYDQMRQTMVFSAGTRQHIRVAYSDERIWYCISDIAKMIGYRDPRKAIGSLNCEVKILHVPHVSPNRRGITICNCVTKEDVIRFISQQRAYPEVRSWIREVVIPQSERQFSGERTQNNRQMGTTNQATIKFTDILTGLDRIITEAVLLKREFQCK